ncbi:D-alanine--D-alanine ligase family protein [Treponema maltophilum]|uniref:D-alanine--D-alanine ligase family protein n=1 Tax=Treponema maltophilum TaxID=51160 RepID=UPI003D937FDB
MTVAVLFGGKSGEHEVSLVSASSVVRRIDRTKHSLVLIGIAKDGLWYVQDESEAERVVRDTNAVLKIAQDPSRIVSLVPGGGTERALQIGQIGTNKDSAKQAKNLAVDIVFPVLHGSYGEDGLVQGLLEMAELPYCGCSVPSSAIAMDKAQTKKIWAYEGLPVVPFACIKKRALEDETLQKKLDEAEKRFGYPLFVKPCSAGSSVGASKAGNRKEFERAVREAFLWDEKILIEECIDAREIECSVTGDSLSCGSASCGSGGKKGGDLRSYEPGEIAPTHGFYDYEAKYTDPNGARLLIPAPITAEQRTEVQAMAERAYAALDCSGLARIDFFIDKKSGKLYLNEINTMPGFTPISMFPKMCEQSGLPSDRLIELLLEQGLDRFKKRRVLKTSFT